MRENDDRSDAALVAAVLDGDQAAFGEVYQRYADRLYDFAAGQLRHREEAFDAVADAFVLAAERLTQLRDPDLLRPWLYAIVRNECRRRLRARSKVADDGADRLMRLADEGATPEEEARQHELAALVWDAAAGLAERDRALLDLHLRHGLDGAELGEAMGMSAGNAYTALHRLRGQVDRSLGALLVARLGRRDCADLASVLTDWDGRFSPLWRKRVARHVDACEVCTRRRGLVASPLALLGAVPILAAPEALRDRVLEDPKLVSALSEPRSGPPPGPAVSRRRLNAGTAVLAATVVTGVVVGTLALRPEPESVRAVDLPVASAAESSGSLDPLTSSSPSSASPVVEPIVEPTAPTSPNEVSVTASPVSPPREPEDPVRTDEPTAPSEQPLTPARLVVDSSPVELRTERREAVLPVRNLGERQVTYTATTAAPWLRISPASGRLAGLRSGSMGLIAEGSSSPEGTVRTTVEVTWSGGTVSVPVRFTRAEPPRIGIPAVTDGRCSTGRNVTVSVPVADESGVDLVTLDWSTSGASGSETMIQRGDRWYAGLGPFPVGTLDLVVTALDPLGNQADRSGSGAITACPG